MTAPCYSIQSALQTTATDLARVVMLPDTVGVEVDTGIDGTNTIYVWTAEAPIDATLAAYEVAVVVWHKRNDRLKDALGAARTADAAVRTSMRRAEDTSEVGRVGATAWREVDRIETRCDDAAKRRAALYALLPREALDRDA